MKSFPQQLRLFEMMRFDFIIDDQDKVHLMEANMSPNLSSAHFKQNRLLYEQVVSNILSLIGLPYKACSDVTTSSHEHEMRVADKDLVVFPHHCKANCFDDTQCLNTECQLCKPCWTPHLEKTLKLAFLEHNHKGSCMRIFPTPLDPAKANTPIQNTNLTAANTLISEWFRGKCLLDKTFCNH